MENNLEIFKNDEFGEVRVVEIAGAPWFVGNDVARALGYGEGKSLPNAIAKHVDDEDKGVTEIVTPGGKQTAKIINESGLYSLILSSKLPQAKQFKHWVTSEVLPTIRKTGGYKTPKQSSDRDKAMLKNAQARSAKLWLEIAKNTGIQTYKDVCNAYAAKELAGEDVLPLPKVQEKSYSATDIGKMLGVSKAKIGALANKNNMKCDEYGSWFHDKSPYSGKEVETFRYNSKAIEKFRALLEGGEQA